MMLSRKSSILYFAILALALEWVFLATSVQAAPKQSEKSAVMDIYLCLSFPLYSAIEANDNINVISGEFPTAEFSSPMQRQGFSPLSARVGLILPSARKWLALEWEYSRLGGATDPRTPVGDGSGHFADLEFAADMVFINLLLRYPEGKIHPYVGAGVGSARMSLESRGGTSTGLSPSANPFHLFSGIDVELSPEWSVGLRYRYLRLKSDLLQTRWTVGNVNETAVDNMRFTSESCSLEIKRFW